MAQTELLLGVPMAAEVTKSCQTDARREPRTSLFVMATLYAESCCIPVKVRDLSAAGALVEGDDIPPIGTNVRLCRGSLTITAHVVWSHGGRAGIHFESSVSVADWLPGGQGRVRQDGVDEIVQRLKSSGTPHALSLSHRTAIPSTMLDAVELTRLRIAVESLAEDLAADADVVKRHMSKLQALDLAAQALAKLAAER